MKSAHRQTVMIMVMVPMEEPTVYCKYVQKYIILWNSTLVKNRTEDEIDNIPEIS